MKETPRHYAAALYTALETVKEKDYSAVLSRLVLLLAKKGLLAKVDSVIKEFEKVYYQNHDIAVAEVVSARPLDSKAQRSIRQLVAKETGKKTVQLVERIDASVLGGVKIVFDDRELDASIRSKLIQLQQHLIL